MNTKVLSRWLFEALNTWTFKGGVLAIHSFNFCGTLLWGMAHNLSSIKYKDTFVTNKIKAWFHLIVPYKYKSQVLSLPNQKYSLISIPNKDKIEFPSEFEFQLSSGNAKHCPFV